MAKQTEPKKLELLLDLKLRDFLPLFHKALSKSTYCGLPILKNPLDLFIYQEIIYRTKPDIIIEIGTYKGGSAKYLDHLLKNVYKKTMVITIDPDNKNNICLNGIMYLRGRANNPKMVDDIQYIIKNMNAWIPGFYTGKKSTKIMVIDDGSHTYDDTLANLNVYSQFVTQNQYYIVEDTICHHGLNTGPKPAPAEAVEEFLKYCGRFLVDRTCERFGLTYNSGGFLKCIKAV